MTTSAKQTSLFTEDQSIFSQGDSLVSRTVSLEREKAQRMLDISGRRCLEQFESAGRPGSLGKTFLALLVGMKGWYSSKCVLTWKMKGTKYNRLYFQLAVSTLRTEGIGFGLLPTPLVMDTASDLEKVDARRKGNKERNNGKNGTKRTGNGMGVTLNELMLRGLLPTPNASDNRDRGGPKDKAVQRRIEIGKQVGLTQMIDGQLSHLFVEEMMGYPINYIGNALKHTVTQ
jgi:hypothetical protein